MTMHIESEAIELFYIVCGLLDVDDSHSIIDTFEESMTDVDPEIKMEIRRMVDKIQKYAGIYTHEYLVRCMLGEVLRKTLGVVRELRGYVIGRVSDTIKEHIYGVKYKPNYNLIPGARDTLLNINAVTLTSSPYSK